MRVAKVSLMAVMAVALASFAVAQSPAPSSTSILVPKMHCKGCAQTMATELYKVPGVGKVLVKLETTTMIVHAKDGQAASPRGMWEAVERAGYQPTRLEGPNGVFTGKPKS